MIINKKIDILNCPISGNILVEASAGTGKTFTIIIFYIRLLLNIGIDKKFNNGLSIQEILVLTFTNKSKEELFNRIKKTIHTFKKNCIQKYSKNIVFNSLIEKIKNLRRAVLTLEIAENNIYYASIFTIHKFCQNLINENKFYFNNIFEKKIISNTEQFYYEATIMFWRKYCYKLPKTIAKIIYQYWKEPKSLSLEIIPLLQQSIKINNQNNLFKKNLIQHHTSLILKIKIFKKKWMLKKNNIDCLLKIIDHTSSNKNINKWQKKINLWIQSNTEDYYIPKELLLFQKTIDKSYKIKNDNNQEIHLFLEYLKEFLKNKFSIKEIFIYEAFTQISTIVKRKKKKLNLLDFNDLISVVYLSLNKNNSYLSKLIQKKHPAVLIDEFQDTDYQQYKIFEKIYRKKNELALIFIADPKQSIYSFRGANIFSYLKIKSKIKSCYHLDTNWRSSLNMNNSINTLFNKIKNPFLLEQIEFIKTNSANNNSNMYFKIQNIKQPGLQIFFKESNSICCTNEYLEWASHQCASNICKWLILSKKKQAIIRINNKKEKIKPEDIAILVRNKNEANIIKETLNTYNLSSTYQSSKDIIYKTKESIELLSILQSIIEPFNQKKMKIALITSILSLSIYEVERINNNHSLQTFFINKFINYLNIWELKGIYYLIKIIIIDSKTLKNFRYNKDNKISLCNILHISEILQKNSKIFLNKKHLLSWFKKKIYLENTYNKDEYVCLNGSHQSINIITIHKSKGLEYPIVWIPFSINFFQKVKCIFYNKNNLEQTIDLYKKTNNLHSSKKEQLSEDIRLIYVALTRSILHCSTCIAPLIKGNKKRTKTYTDVHKSGLGYILQKGQKLSKEALKSQLMLFNKTKYIKIVSEKIKLIKYPLTEEKPSKIIFNTINRKITDDWNVHSYSRIKSNIEEKINSNKIEFYNNKLQQNTINNNSILSTHTFPRGKISGNFLHRLLKHHNFSKEPNCSWISKEVKNNNFSLKWIDLIKEWIFNITNTFLNTNTNTITLSKLKNKEYIKEFEFYIPIKHTISSNSLNYLLKSFNSSISKKSKNLTFDSIKGILVGSIDLVFFWKEKYYLIDYKSNWLGKDNTYYNKHSIHKTIIKYKYDLQYQIYSLALHRYLKKRIHNYSLKKHFGGIFYLFIRAFTKINQTNGTFFTIPSYDLIKKLDKLL